MTDQDLKWWHVRWRLAGRAISRFAVVGGKVTGVLGLVAAMGYGVIYLMSPWLASQSMSSPRLSIVPTDLPTEAAAPLSDAINHSYGFSFRLPNEEVASTFRGEDMTLIRFRSGGSLMANNPSRDSWIFAIANSNKDAAKLIGPEIFPTKFSLVQAATLATPEQVKWWKFRTAANERVAYLLVMKFSLLTHNYSSQPFTLGPIYTISGEGFRGFQFGNPDVPPYDAHVDLFDGADRYFSFDVSGPQEHGQVLTQADINAMVTSIRHDF